MVGGHYQLSRHEFVQAPGDSEEQRNLACCHLSGCKESDTTERLSLTHGCIRFLCCYSAAKSRSTLQPHGLQHASLPVLHHLLQFCSDSCSNQLILSHPLLRPSILPSIRVFPSELALCIRLPKYWRFSFSIRPSNEYSGLISFRISRFDLLAAQGIRT